MPTRIDIRRYLAMKKAGRVSLGTIGNVKVAMFKRTDPVLGRAVDPELEQMRPRILKQMKADLQVEMDGIDELLSDLEAL